MPVSQQAFWGQVKHERNKLGTALSMGKYPAQPAYDESKFGFDPERPNFHPDLNIVFITSLDHNDRGTRAGFTVEATVEVAGLKLVEQTHRISTAEDIAKWKQHQEDQRSTISQSNAVLRLRKIQADMGFTDQDAIDAREMTKPRVEPVQKLSKEALLALLREAGVNTEEMLEAATAPK